MSGKKYKYYLLAVLTFVLISNSVDRLVLGLLLQDIKLDLDLSDTQLGVLTGIAFAFFYSIMGIPIARWADTGNRITVITVTTALWSVMAALCGVVTNFAQLLLVRVGVAIGEAGCIPPAHSLIADYFSRDERPRAMSIYMLGGALSTLIGYFLGGWLGEHYGWRATFIMLSVPGVLLALLVRFSLREPRLATNDHQEQAPVASQDSLSHVFNTLWCNSTFRHLTMGFAVSMFFGSGIGQWLPSFFVRSHGMSVSEVGFWFAFIYGVGAAVGAYCGGVLASRYAARNERLQLRVMAVAYILYGCISVFIYIATSKYLALNLLAIGAFLAAITFGPLFAVIQLLVKDRMRATAIAIVYLFANLIGMGFGPLLVGVLSDAFAARWGDESLRYALIAVCPGYLWVATHWLLAARTVSADIAAMQKEQGSDEKTGADLSKVTTSVLNGETCVEPN